MTEPTPTTRLQLIERLCHENVWLHQDQILEVIADGSSPDVEGVNVVLTFEDQDGQEWLAAAFMAPLKRSGSDETCTTAEMPDRAFALKRFNVVKHD